MTFQYKQTLIYLEVKINFKINLSKINNINKPWLE